MWRFGSFLDCFLDLNTLYDSKPKDARWKVITWVGKNIIPEKKIFTNGCMLTNPLPSVVQHLISYRAPLFHNEVKGLWAFWKMSYIIFLRQFTFDHKRHVASAMCSSRVWPPSPDMARVGEYVRSLAMWCVRNILPSFPISNLSDINLGSTFISRFAKVKLVVKVKS